jgi:5,10-methylenetetrahydrofolate reductase
VPGIVIPDMFMRRMETSDNPQKEGVLIAKKIYNDLSGMTEGICFMPPFGKYDLLEKIV